MHYQFGRAKYFFNKLSKLKSGSYPNSGGNIEYELYTFFEAAYHVKEYIKNDENYKMMSDVEEYVNKTVSLRICADICNRLKHKTLTKRRSREELGPFEISTQITIGPKYEDSSVKLVSAKIYTEAGKLCCFELAQRILDDWRKYFLINNINTP